MQVKNSISFIGMFFCETEGDEKISILFIFREMDLRYICAYES